MRKVKILFAIPDLDSTTEGRAMLNIIEGIDKKVFEPWIAVEKGGGELFDEVIAKGYPIIVEPFLGSGNRGFIETYIQAKKTAKVFKDHSFDIWQSFNSSSDYAEALVAKAAGAMYVYVKGDMDWGTKAWVIKSSLAKRIVARNNRQIERLFSSKRLIKKTLLIHESSLVDQSSTIKEVGVSDSIQEVEMEVEEFVRMYKGMM